MARALAKEHAVLLGTLAVLGLLAWRGSGTEAGERTRARTPRARGAAELEVERHAVPDPSLASAGAGPAVAAGARDLFAPPRDTRPLAPLAVAPPPLEPLTALRPPSDPGVAPAHYGRFLRASAAPKPVPGLFAGADGEAQEEAVDERPTPEELALLEDAPRALTPEQRAAELESFFALYDWVRIHEGDPLFGRIENPERYELPRRPAEPVLFVELDPRTGEERFPGMQPVAYARERVLEFGFADTPQNRILLRRAELAGELSASRSAQLIALADECLELRTPLSLRIAEESYLRAAAFDPADPAPLLGLGRCYEAGFRLEDAYRAYQDLSERFAHRPEGFLGLAGLEARLHLFRRAEEHLLHAVELARTSHAVQAALGRFLLDRGRYREALDPLREAYRFEPGEPSALRARAEIRASLGEALLAAGELEEALSFFDRALSADAGHQRALAGRLAALDLGAGGGEPAAGAIQAAGAGESADFALLLTQALVELRRGDPGLARDQLLRAAESDPLRAPRAWRALSWLAETSGYPEEALRWIEEAHAADPTDPWTLYQRGRLLAARGDEEGARGSLTAALERELVLPDALALLAELAQRSRDHAGAELFYERALAFDPARPELAARRGWNLLEQGEIERALPAFDAALALDADEPLAHAGRAWAAYLRGDAERAITLFAELDDRRRALSEDDPYRVYAMAQVARIKDHLSKEAWTDAFERRQLKNGWSTEEAAGPEVRLEDGRVAIAGSFERNGVARVLRSLPAADFISFAADLAVAPENNARVGVFLAKERRRGAGQVEVQGMLGAAREKDGRLALLAMDVVQADPPWVDVPELAGEEGWWPAGRSVRVLVERVGEGLQATARVFLDGVLVREGIPFARLSSSNAELLVGVFVEGQTGLPARVELDDVELVYRTHR
jgi:tetratricopeptide (TPR) repeat protein